MIVYVLDSYGRLIETLNQDEKAPLPKGLFTLKEPPKGNFVWFDFALGDWVSADVMPDAWLDDKRQSLFDAIAARRFQAEVSGVIMPDGSMIATDRESQAKVASAFVSLQAGLIPSTAWKTATGSWVDLDKSAISLVSAAVSGYVASCYAAEKAHYLKIQSLKTLDELLSYDVESGWPSQNVGVNNA